MSKYKLVPMKPTQEMLEAGVQANYGVTIYDTAEIIFCAMLAAAPEVEQEPVVWIRRESIDSAAVDRANGFPSGLMTLAVRHGENTIPLYLHPQTSPKPDAALVAALEEIAQWVGRYAAAGHPVATVARKAIAVYRQQGGEA